MMVIKLTLIDLSGDCMCCIRSSTRCALTHARWGDHSNTQCYCNAKMQDDLVEQAPQIDVRIV
jgi:hypothetical protein